MSGRVPMSDDERWQLLPACAAASCIVPACAALLSVLLSIASGSLAMATILGPLVFIGGLIVAGGHVILLGLPLYLLARAFGPVDWPAATIAGALIGALPIQVVIGASGGGGGEERIAAAIQFGAFGLASALIFWRTATRA